ncbi:MAG: E3 ubiquitin ligase family protein [Thermonemataceae bacterium]|nr:E3 ubiquitin ligase family protein [Thermonemataceae bacterium]
MIGIIIGVVLIGVAVGLWFYRKNQMDKALNIRYQETTTTKFIWENYESISVAVGNGNYTEIVELKGVARCQQPLQAEHSKMPVVYYRASVIREYEVEEQETDSNGNTRWVTKRRSDTISTNEQSVPFYVDDNSGKPIRVDMQGADKITQKTMDRFEREFSQSYLNEQSWGSQFSSYHSSSNYNSSNTLGYRLVEEAIPVNAQLYIYGEASDRNGELSVIKPKDKNQNFIVSVKSEEQLVESAQSSAKWSLIGMIASAVGGVAAIVWGIVAG